MKLKEYYIEKNTNESKVLLFVVPLKLCLTFLLILSELIFLACFSGLYTFRSNRLITIFGIISSIENAVNKYLNIASKINLV